MKRRQLLLSLTLLLVVGFCWRTSSFAQANLPGQISVQINGDFAIGETLTVTVTSSDQFTKEDLVSAVEEHRYGWFESVEFQDGGNSFHFEISTEPTQDFNINAVASYLEGQLNSRAQQRVNDGIIEDGRTPSNGLKSDDAAIMNAGNANALPAGINAEGVAIH
jgi:hypothetical protein